MGKKKPQGFEISKDVTPQTRAFMEGVVKKLEAVEAIEVCDYPALMMLQLSYDQYLRASEMLLRDGCLSKEKHGRVIVHPAVNVVNKYWGQVVTLLKEFGLTVKSRERIAAMTPEIDEDNEFMQFQRNQLTQDDEG